MWHKKSMDSKSTKVKRHLRLGKVVASHDRIIKTNNTKIQQPHSPDVSSLMSLGQMQETGEKIKVVIDRNGKKIDLSKSWKIYGADLSGYDLRNLAWDSIEVLHDANLSGAILDGVDIQGKFERCNFNGASMKNVKIGGDTDFSDSTFEGANFEGTEFGEANESFLGFKYCFLDNARFSKNKMIKVSFENCTLKGAKWENVNLTNVNIFSSDMTSMELNGVIASGATMSRVNLARSSIVDSYFKESAFSFESTKKIKKLFRTIIEDTQDAAGLQIRDSDFISCEFRKNDFSETSLHNVSFDNSSLRSVKLTGAQMEGTISFEGSWMESVRGANQDYSNANFRNTQFADNEGRSDMSGSNFSGANFTGAIIGNTNVKRSNWAGADTSDLQIFPDATSVAVLSAPDRPVQDQSNNSYEHYSFEEVAKDKGYSDKQIEFLVLSGVIEVRNNHSKLKENKNIHPDHHHIPVWSVQNLPDVKPETV